MSWPGEILETLRADDNYRSLATLTCSGARLEHEGRTYVNLSSNDYLGLSGEAELQREFFSGLGDGFVMSNPSSRLITGNSSHYDRLEATLEELYDRPALVLGSGYLANSGALPALTARGDLILADKYVHASIIDGLRLCEAEWKRFNHNDTAHLERLLRAAAGYRRVWVVTESLFSMDGDFAPLGELDKLRSRYGFRLYIDEAHAFGVRGGGLGYCRERGVEADVLVATLGKTTASCGAFAVCDGAIRELLVNRMRTLIFSTALPPINLAWSDFVLRRMASFDGLRTHLQRLSNILTDSVQASQIVPLMCYDNARAIEAARRLREEGFWVSAIRYPTVPRGKARIRVSLNAALGEEDVLKFKNIWNSIK